LTVGSLHFKSIEPFSELCDWATPHVAFHSSNAVLVEKNHHCPMTIVLFLSILVQDLID
jgi:hypothetical protein